MTTITHRTEAEWQARERELLEASNRYLQEARDTRSSMRGLQIALDQAWQSNREREDEIVAMRSANQVHGVTADQIKHMVGRFLTWKLPENFNPDGGVSFKAEFNENTAWPMRHEPSGTNLFDASQADAMVRHMLDGLPSAPPLSGEVEAALRDEWTRFCDANPDDLTSPEDLPDHALMTCEQFVEFALAALSIAPATADGWRTMDSEIECHGLDTPDRVCFYEQDFYVLSNFSSFRLRWRGYDFDTSEAVYHWEKFQGPEEILAVVRREIHHAGSAHEAFKIAERNKGDRRPDWDAVKVDIMRDILRAKADQHEYVRRKLLATGNRELVENSWRDDFWGWGSNRNGKNMLGKLWMEVRDELRALPAAPTGDAGK